MGRANTFHRQWFMSGAIILVAVALAVTAFYYLARDLEKETAQIAADRMFIADQTAILGTLAALKSAETQSAPYLAAMQKLLPTHDGLIGFPQWIAGLASADAVTASVSFTGNNVSASDSVAGSDGFSLSVSGSPSAIAAFLDDLGVKAAGYLIAIDSFTFINGGAGGTLTLQGRIFSR